ncbi:MAG: phosphoribosylaminoimidazolesuccinocarboxamide synthase [Candidatus Berkelbacteria bacterium]|nr:phosphoribosylaminoimidazolesuccinocarboxamide synthase [Candidatus Berkelbacteria bacterium]
MNMKTLPTHDNIGNFSRGIYEVDIPELGKPTRGKVRDNWVIERSGKTFRIIVTTDRQSIFVRSVCTVPGKGRVSNLISAFWFDLTKDIIPNHVISIVHPNVLIAKQAVRVVPIELVLRRYIARGLSPTSISLNYFERGRREIYGIKFPNGLLPNQELPMGTIITPTTKATDGHDEELTDDQARTTVDSEFGRGTWKRISVAALSVFERARQYSSDRGLILADTKFEFGIDEGGNIMLIDELLTPDGSRFWTKEGYENNLKTGGDLGLDKEILARWLKEKGFDGKGVVPVIDETIIRKTAEVFERTYEIITGNLLPKPKPNQDLIRKAVLNYLDGVNS